MLHVAVISEFELGSHRAHAINVVKTAGGFVRLGHRVTLLCRPARGCAGETDPSVLLAQYAEPCLQCEVQPFAWTDDEAGSLGTGQWAATRAAALGANVVYARHFAGALESAALGMPTVMETHAYVGAVKPILDEALRATARLVNPLAVVTISPRLRDHYIERGGSPGRIHIVPDGVDLDLFVPPAKLPPSRYVGLGPHAVYSGHLYDYKGIPTVLDAAALSPDTQFHLVGGTHEDETRIRASVAFAQLRNVTIHGHVPHREVPAYLWNADVLLLPPSATDPSANWTSPVKLGEYLASGPPIVASAIPGLKDWVEAPAVRWFEPDCPRALVRAIEAAFAETKAQTVRRRAAAGTLAEGFSYANRARQILCAAEVETRHQLPKAA